MASSFKERMAAMNTVDPRTMVENVPDNRPDNSTETKKATVKLTEKSNVKESKKTEIVSKAIAADKTAKAKGISSSVGARVPKAILLSHDLNRKLRIMAKRNGQSIQNYVSILLETEAKEALKEDLEERATRLYEETRKYGGTKERTTAYIPVEIWEKSSKDFNNAGINFADYMAYIVDKRI